MQFSGNWSFGSTGSAEDFIWVNSFEWRVASLLKAEYAWAQRYGIDTIIPRAHTMNKKWSKEVATRATDQEFGTGTTDSVPSGEISLKEATIRVPATGHPPNVVIISSDSNSHRTVEAGLHAFPKGKSQQRIRRSFQLSGYFSPFLIISYPAQHEKSRGPLRKPVSSSA